MRKLPHLILRGTYRAMGESLGRQLKNLITRSVAYHLAHLSHLGWRDRKAREQLVAQYRSPFRQACLSEYLFLEGVAAGTGRSFIELLTVNIEEEFFAHDPKTGLTHCSALAYRDPGSGGALIGHNEDWLRGDGPYQYVLTLIPQRGPRILTLTYGALLPVNGLNSAGLAAVYQTVYADDDRVGIPRLPLASSLLRMTSIDAAVRQATRAGRAGGYHYFLGDASGRVVSLETSATRQAKYYDGKPQKIIAHTNHYLASKMTSHISKKSVSSAKRLKRLTTCASRTGEGSVVLFEAILSDHTNGSDAICNHGDHSGSNPKYDGKTLSSLILDTAHRALLVRPGNPCTTPPRLFTL